MKKQRIFWLDDKDWKMLQEKIKEYYSGRGAIERFMEKVARERIIFVQYKGKITLIVE